MTADLIRLVLVLGMAPLTIANTAMYGIGSPWYKSTIGWWLFLDVFGLAWLVNLSVIYRFFGDNYWARDIVSITVFAIILLGQVFGFVTLARELIRRRRGDR